jgi:hypothetical protein
VVLPYEGKFAEWAKLVRLRRYKEGYYALIGCYLDESVDPKKKGLHQGLFTVGGILGQCPTIFELDRKWEQLRTRPDIALSYFKASECQLAKKQFRKFVSDPKVVSDEERKRLDAIWNEFLDVLVSCGPIGIFGVGVIQEDFYEVIKDPVAKQVLGPSPYWFAYQAAMIEAAFGMKKIRNMAAFVCDNDEEHSEVAPDVYIELKKKNPNAACYMGPFTLDSDIGCEPLQAADAAIYEVRRALHVSLGRWKQYLQSGTDVRPEFRKLADNHCVWLMQYADKKYLENVVENNLPGEPLNLDHYLEQEFNEDIKF